MVMVLERVTELDPSVPTKLHTADDTELFKQIYSPVNGNPVVLAGQMYKLLERRHRVVLKQPEYMHAGRSYEVAISL